MDKLAGIYCSCVLSASMQGNCIGIITGRDTGADMSELQILLAVMSTAFGIAGFYFGEQA